MGWFEKLKKIVHTSNNDNNPTVDSMIYMLNHMVDEYGRYKELGSVEYLGKCKEHYESEHRI